MHEKILGVGKSFPPYTCNNKTIGNLIGNGWENRSRTIDKIVGVQSRYMPAFTTEGFPDPKTPVDEVAMAAEAAQAALTSANCTGDDISRLIYVSGTASQASWEGLLQGLSKPVFRLHHALGLSRTIFADGRDRACGGFLSALCDASLFLSNPSTCGQKILVVVSNEAYSKGNRKLYTETGAIASLMVFGCGAGAVVLGADEGESGVIGFVRFTDSNPDDVLVSMVPSKNSPDGPFAARIESKTVEKNFVPGMLEALRELETLFPEARNPDFYLLHQPNGVLMKKLLLALNVNPLKVPLVVADVGNISGAFIPVLLDSLMRKGRLQSGDRIVCAAIGEGEHGALLYRVP